MATAQGLVDYIAASPSPFHCVAESVRRLEEAGFRRRDMKASPEEIVAGSRSYVHDAGTLVAWIAGERSPAESGFRIVGAHTDSPNLRLKPQAEYSKEGYVQWGVEVYGGVLRHTWLDRDLGISGRVAVRHGKGHRTVLVRIDEPVARVPSLAIHLDRDVTAKGLIVNAQKHLPPVVGLEGGGQGLSELLSQAAGVKAEDLLTWDVGLHDVQAPTIGGLNQEFIFAPRLDNQASCYTALEGLLSLEGFGESTAMICLFDHEEVGSTSAVGASSTYLRNVLAVVERGHGGGAEGGLERAAAQSFMVSADMAHGIHPNHADRHEGHHKPRLNGGPVIKSNANLRYATDAGTAARFRLACEAEKVDVQEFVNRTDLACGSTIGPLSAAQLAIETVDVGCAMLSMHSIREQCGAHDVDAMTRALGRILIGG
jgi:aspartyl aminopeptidase